MNDGEGFEGNRSAFWKRIAESRETQLAQARDLAAEQTELISFLQQRVSDLENQLAWLQGLDRLKVELVAGVPIA